MRILAPLDTLASMLTGRVGAFEPRRAPDPLPEVPPHAPVSGWIGRLLGPLQVTGVFWYRFHKWGVRILPARLVGPVVFGFTLLFFLVLRHIRRAIGDNLDVVLGPCDWRERQRRIFRTLHSYAWCLTEHYEHLHTDRRVAVSIEDGARLPALESGGRGVVLVTAHVGQWEAGSMLAAAFEQRHVHVIREAEMDPPAQAFVERQVAETAPPDVTVHFVCGQATLGWRLLRALREGEIVALQGDRPYTGGRSAPAAIFGRSIDLPLGPAALARSAGVPILPVFIFRDHRSHARVVFRPPITVSQDRDATECTREATQQIAREVEWAIGHQPHQWFCFRRLWGTSEHRRGRPAQRPAVLEPEV